MAEDKRPNEVAATSTEGHRHTVLRYNLRTLISWSDVMSDFQSLILQMWKIAGQQSRLESGITALKQLLQERFSVDGIVFGRFHVESGYVETLSRVFSDGSRDNLHFHDWAAEKNHIFKQRQPLISCDDDLSQIFMELADDPPKKSYLYYPMTETEDISTFFLLVLDEPLEWNENLAILCIEISEMLLGNFRKELEYRHLVQQREAAEAEKQAALQKLGRKNVVEEVIGQNHGLKQVFERLEVICRSDTSVMLLGENGTGKELIARTIHLRSLRSEKPFYRFNCGAFSREMMSRVLFGQEKKQRDEIVPGILEKADGGTLFLDDVHELTLAAQVALCDFLENGMFQRYGGETFQTADVRLITATDHDLQQLVCDSRFSEPLWYKLTVFPIRIPSLREREPDMKELAEHFARRAATRFGLPLVLPTADDLLLLQNYSWPGNVRELGTVIDRAAILGNGRKLEIASALGLHHTKQDAKSHSLKNQSVRWDLFQTIEPLDDLLNRYFTYVLEITQGKIEGKNGAAALLGVHPNTLRARMRKLGIDWKKFADLE